MTEQENASRLETTQRVSQLIIQLGKRGKEEAGKSLCILLTFECRLE